MEKCLIFCAAEFDRLAAPIGDGDYILAADGGDFCVCLVGSKAVKMVAQFAVAAAAAGAVHMGCSAAKAVSTEAKFFINTRSFSTVSAVSTPSALNCRSSSAFLRLMQERTFFAVVSSMANSASTASSRPTWEISKI